MSPCNSCVLIPIVWIAVSPGRPPPCLSLADLTPCQTFLVFFLTRNWYSVFQPFRGWGTQGVSSLSPFLRLYLHIFFFFFIFLFFFFPSFLFFLLFCRGWIYYLYSTISFSNPSIVFFYFFSLQFLFLFPLTEKYLKLVISWFMNNCIRDS